jgi:hypothetical protein
MSAAQPADTSIDVIVAKNGAARHFTGIEEFVSWSHEERRRWQWQQKARETSPQTKPVFVAQFSTLTQLIVQYEGVAQGPLEDRLATSRRIAQGISEAVGRGQLLTSESPEGKLVLELATSRPVAGEGPDPRTHHGLSADVDWPNKGR